MFKRDAHWWVFGRAKMAKKEIKKLRNPMGRGFGGGARMRNSCSEWYVIPRLHSIRFLKNLITFQLALPSFRLRLHSVTSLSPPPTPYPFLPPLSAAQNRATETLRKKDLLRERLSELNSALSCCCLQRARMRTNGMKSETLKFWRAVFTGNSKGFKVGDTTPLYAWHTLKTDSCSCSFSKHIEFRTSIWWPFLLQII